MLRVTTQLLLNLFNISLQMSKITKSARGKPCQVRIPGVCNGDPNTVVLAHLNGGGMAVKHHDIHGAYCCSACHDVVDRRVHVDGLSQDDILLIFLEGILRTQLILLEEGLLYTAHP